MFVFDGKDKHCAQSWRYQGLHEISLMLADGSKVEVDVVMLAPGYDNILMSAQKILGDEAAGGCKDVWDLGDEGEVTTINWFFSSIAVFVVGCCKMWNGSLLID